MQAAWDNTNNLNRTTDICAHLDAQTPTTMLSQIIDFIFLMDLFPQISAV